MELQTVTDEREIDVATHGEIAICDSSGDTKVIWSRDNADEVDAARAQFKTLKKKGFACFKVVGKNGDKGEQVDEFESSAERYIMVPPLVGG